MVAGRAPSGRGERWVTAQLVLGLIALLAGILGPPWPASVRAPLAAVGVGVAAAGLALVVVGSRQLAEALTPYPAPRPGALLHREGVYRVVRHPIYAGVVLLAGGWALLTSPVALAVAATFAMFVELKSRLEERLLVDRYPEYPEYRRRVRWKFVPGVR